MKTKITSVLMLLVAIFLFSSCSTPVKYSIFFDSVGGRTVESMIYKVGEAPLKLDETTKEGYVFLGWYSSNDAGITLNEQWPNEVLFNKDITLYAKWQIEQAPEIFTVTFEPNNEADRIPLSYEINSLVVKPENINNQGKVLVGWYESYLFDGKQWDFTNDKVLADITLYAKWGTQFENTAQYKGDVTVEMRDDINNAAVLGLDPYVFDVQSNKNVSNNVGLNKAGYLRIYRPSPQNGKENILSISIHDSFIITGVNIIFGGEKGDAKLTLGTQIITLSNYGTNLSYSELNITSLSITNTMASGNRTDIKSIEFTYIQIGPDPIRIDDINRPVIEMDETNKLVELNIGETFLEPTLTALDFEDGPLPVILDEKTLPNMNVAGIYYVWFKAIDSDGNETKAYITVVVRNEMKIELYYQGHDGLSGVALKSFLNSLLKNTLTLQTYEMAKYALEVTDRDPNNFDNVLLMYDRDSDKGKWNHPIWEREHVWPNSKLGIDRVTNDQANIGSDLHNLRAIRPHVNQTRSNYMFVNPTNPTDGFGVVSAETYYPGLDDKGDVARIIFYMNTVWLLEIREDIQMLINWHLEDPVDDFELIRNELIFGYQGNRNPYIDYPEFVLSVYGMVTLSNGQTVSFKLIMPVIDLETLRNRKHYIM